MLQQDPQPLRLLHIKSQFSLILFDLCKLKSLLQIEQFLFLTQQLLIDFFHLELKWGYLAILADYRGLSFYGFGACLGLRCTLVVVLAHVFVEYLSVLEILKELFWLGGNLVASVRVEHLLHDLLNHDVFSFYEALLTLELGFQELIHLGHLVKLLFEVDFLLV